MRDRHFVFLILAAFAVLAALWARPAGAANPDLAPDAHCDPNARANSWTPAEKARTRDRVRSACEARGGSDLYCDFHIAAVKRESWGGIASAVHRLGADGDGEPEYGLGPQGLSLRWHRDKWPGSDEEPAFCVPEVSYLVADAIARRAVRVYGASNAVELQAVFGGGRGVTACYERGAPRWWRLVPGLSWLARFAPREQECFVTPLRRHADAVCKRMAGCWHPISIDDLGGDDGLVAWDSSRSTYVVTAAGRAWAMARASSS